MLNILPTWQIAAATFAAGAVAGGVGMHVWDKGTIAALNLTLAQTKQAQAEGVSKASQAALSDLTAAAASIKTAAESGHVDVTALGAKLDTLNRSFKNAKAAPLPVDCRPGAERVRSLAESAAAVDQAIARSVPGK